MRFLKEAFSVLESRAQALDPAAETRDVVSGMCDSGGILKT
jgi:hypothetical protein